MSEIASIFMAGAITFVGSLLAILYWIMVIGGMLLVGILAVVWCAIIWAMALTDARYGGGRGGRPSKAS